MDLMTKVQQLTWNRFNDECQLNWKSQLNLACGNKDNDIS